MTDHITLRRAAEQALEALDESLYMNDYCGLEISKRDEPYVTSAIEALRAALAEPVQEITDTERLNWLDTLPCGITIHGDSSFPQSQSATPKTPGASHIRDLIDRNRAQRKNK